MYPLTVLTALVRQSRPTASRVQPTPAANEAAQSVSFSPSPLEATRVQKPVRGGIPVGPEAMNQLGADAGLTPLHAAPPVLYPDCISKVGLAGGKTASNLTLTDQ